MGTRYWPDGGYYNVYYILLIIEKLRKHMGKKKGAADELAELILKVIQGSGIGFILGIIVLAIIMILGNKGII